MELDPPSDAILITASIEDPRLFSTLFDRYYDEIFRYLARRIGREDAEDLSAECFVVAFRTRASFDPARASARPWLFGVATNLLRNERRRSANRQVAARRLHTQLEHLETSSTEQVVVDRSSMRNIARQLDELRDDQRDALILVAVFNLTYAEAAEALGIPIGTLRSRVAYARARLTWTPTTVEIPK
jgi:RNA polymerase sigma-70 factor (ECF subfamily)